MNTPAPLVRVAGDWSDVIAGLTGLRLAIYDELLKGGAVDAAQCAARLAADGARAEALTPALPAAVAWLVQHRLLMAEGGQWRAVMLPLARMNYESDGPATAQPAPQPAPAPAARGATAAVQRHQVEFFTMAGYREANGSVG